jgi:indolepyruvate ferredoxin oxidoreductase
MHLLAKGKRLRGTAFDPFGRTGERRLERALIAAYRGVIGTLPDRLTAENLPEAVALLRSVEKVRGFGPVKQATADIALQKLRNFRSR